MSASTTIKRILLVAAATCLSQRAVASDSNAPQAATPAIYFASDAETFGNGANSGANSGVRRVAYTPQTAAAGTPRGVVQANGSSYVVEAQQPTARMARTVGNKPLTNDSVMLPEPVASQPLPGESMKTNTGAGPDKMLLSSDDPRLLGGAMNHGVLDPIENHDFSPEAPICSSGCGLNSELWFAEADVVYLHHSRPDEKILLQDLSIDGMRQFKASDASYDWSPTANLTFGKYLGRDCQNRDHDIEFSFLTPITWQGDAAITSQARVNLFAPENQRFAGFNFADTATEHVESQFSSYELNWRIRTRIGRDQMVYHCDGTWKRECTPNYTYSLLVGVRFLSLDDNYSLRTRISTIPDTGFHGNYDVTTQNYLFGPQIGGDLIEQHCNWNYGARAKLGLLYGNSTAHRVVDGLDNVIGGLDPVTIDSKQHGEQLCFMGDIGLTASYNFRPNLVGRVAYDFMLVTDVAQAPHQVKFQQNVESVLFSELVMHGLSLGLEYQW